MVLVQMLPMLSLERLQLPQYLRDSVQRCRHGSAVHNAIHNAAKAPGAQQSVSVDSPHAVDFGSGSGNLTLPLAWLLPELHLTAVDHNGRSIERLKERAQLAGLRNVHALESTIEAFKCALAASFDPLQV